MSNPLQLQFDANQEYQLEAVRSVVNLFKGFPRRVASFALGDEIVSNYVQGPLDERWLHENLQVVQLENQKNNVPIDVSMFLDVEQGLPLEGTSNDTVRYPEFTIEMETGTGKTYVYLRTLYELRREYGFSKFIVVVPSIAIYEGVIKNFEITRDHFRSLYGNETLNLYQYDGSQLSRLRQFATSTFADVMVMTLDSFNKASNVIFRASEKLPGERKPYQFLQETRPILILDEPQNFESDKSREALRTLNPLFALRYSATHKRVRNLVYRLTPFEAFRRRLVKQIEVWGVTEKSNPNQQSLSIEDITIDPITAVVRVPVADKAVTLKKNSDLYTLVKHPNFQHGFRVSEINAARGYLEFESGDRYYTGIASSAHKHDIFRVQIRETIRKHLETQERLRPFGIKVLSLFFIDRVANYTDAQGIIRILFDQEFNRLKHMSDAFAKYSPEALRRAYFASKKTKAGQEIVETAIEEQEKTKADREAEKEAYKLIMQDKERLLSFEEPVCFIFAHSALKEGWDNPNVFQICSLNQAVSEPRRRQEIGRGLRLPVNQQGERLHDERYNVLTVIANESYSAFADGLQKEYRDAGEEQGVPVRNAKRSPARRNEKIFSDARFQEFIQKLLRRTSYQIHIDDTALVAECVERLNAAQIPQPVIVVEQGNFNQTTYTIRLDRVIKNSANLVVERVSTTGEEYKKPLPGVDRGKSLARLMNDERLRDFKVTSVDELSESITFGADTILYRQQPLTHTFREGASRVRTAEEEKSAYPVFNLLDRAAKETGLTRPTLNQIFRSLNPAQREKIFKNPEGFAATFIATISTALADHIAKRIEFTIQANSLPFKPEDLFAETIEIPDGEMTPAGSAGLYDFMQTDSDVEIRFVKNKLVPDSKVVAYFKFPARYKLDFPKIIGDYNPDWGILRWNDDNTLVLQLVRETKGKADLTALRFDSESRKIVTAHRHFAAVGINYRHVTDDTLNWWHEEAKQVGID